jgi:hypothetical protein
MERCEEGRVSIPQTIALRWRTHTVRRAGAWSSGGNHCVARGTGTSHESGPGDRRVREEWITQYFNIAWRLPV